MTAADSRLQAAAASRHRQCRQVAATLGDLSQYRQNGRVRTWPNVIAMQHILYPRPEGVLHMPAEAHPKPLHDCK